MLYVMSGKFIGNRWDLEFIIISFRYNNERYVFLLYSLFNVKRFYLDC